MVRQHHHGRNGGIETHGLDIFGNLFHGLVQQSFRLVVHFICDFVFGRRMHNIVELVLEAHDAGDLTGLPRLDSFQRTHEHFVQSKGIGSCV